MQFVVAFQILGYALAVLGGGLILIRTERIRFSLKNRVMKSLLSFGWRTQVATVTSYVNQRVRPAIALAFGWPAGVGPVRCGGHCFIGIGLSPAILSDGDACRHGSNLSRDGAKALIGKSFRTSLFWLVACCSALFIIAPWLISFVFGSKFIASGLACRILLPGSASH